MRVGVLLGHPLDHLSGLIETYAENYYAGDGLPEVEVKYWALAIKAATQISDHLRTRASIHDASKLVSPERLHFERANLELGKHEYGTPEYNASREKHLGTALNHHWKNNRHHPEHYAGGIFDMCLLDVIEMLCDWKAATEREQGAAIDVSITKNTKRYDLTTATAKVFTNTVRWMEWTPEKPQNHRPTLISMLNILCKAYATSVNTDAPIANVLKSTMKSHGVSGQLLGISENTLSTLEWIN